MLCLNYGFPNVVKYFMPWRYFREQSQTHFFLLMNSKYSNLCTRQISFNMCSMTIWYCFFFSFNQADNNTPPKRRRKPSKADPPNTKKWKRGCLTLLGEMGDLPFSEPCRTPVRAISTFPTTPRHSSSSALGVSKSPRNKSDNVLTAGLEKPVHRLHHQLR